MRTRSESKCMRLNLTIKFQDAHGIRGHYKRLTMRGENYGTFNKIGIEWVWVQNNGLKTYNGVCQAFKRWEQEACDENMRWMSSLSLNGPPAIKSH